MLIGFDPRFSVANSSAGNDPRTASALIHLGKDINDPPAREMQSEASLQKSTRYGAFPVSRGRDTDCAALNLRNRTDGKIRRPRLSL